MGITMGMIFGATKHSNTQLSNATERSAKARSWQETVCKTSKRAVGSPLLKHRRQIGASPVFPDKQHQHPIVPRGPGSKLARESHLKLWASKVPPWAHISKMHVERGEGPRSHLPSVLNRRKGHMFSCRGWDSTTRGATCAPSELWGVLGEVTTGCQKLHPTKDSHWNESSFLYSNFGFEQAYSLFKCVPAP